MVMQTRSQVKTTTISTSPQYHTVWFVIFTWYVRTDKIKIQKKLLFRNQLRKYFSEDLIVFNGKWEEFSVL